jgi:membrane-associated phospholipid phosphatase
MTRGPRVALAVPRTPQRLLAWAGLGTVLLVAFTALVFLAPPVRSLDSTALQGFQIGSQSAEPDNVHRIAHTAMPVPVAILTAMLVAFALLRRRPERALAVLVLVAGAGTITEVLKHILAHSRAVDSAAAYQVDAASYPSGHATVTMSLVLAAVIVAPRTLRPMAATLGAAWAAAVSFAMLILHRHFPSDVLAGYLVAGAWCLYVLAALRVAEGRLARPGEPHQMVKTRAARPLLVAAIMAAFAATVITVRALNSAQSANQRATATVVAAAIVATVGLIAALGTASRGGGRPRDGR